MQDKHANIVVVHVVQNYTILSEQGITCHCIVEHKIKQSKCTTFPVSEWENKRLYKCKLFLN